MKRLEYESKIYWIYQNYIKGYSGCWSSEGDKYLEKND